MSFADKLRAVGLVSFSEAAQAVESKSDAVAPAASVDFKDFPEWVLQWAHAGIQLLGSKQLEKALESSLTGMGRDASAFEKRIEGALDQLPTSRANELRSYLFSLFRGKGCPTFNSNARAVLDAIQSGAVDAWIEHEREQATQAEALTWPKPEEGEDLEDYGNRLRSWGADKPGALLKRIQFEVYDIMRAERERREKIAAEAAKIAKKQAIAELHDGLKVLKAGDEQAKLITDWLTLHKYPSKFSWEYNELDNMVSAAIGTTSAPWALWIRMGGYRQYSSDGALPVDGLPADMTPDDQREIIDSDLLRAALTSHKALTNEVARRWPVQTGNVRLIEAGTFSEYGETKPARFVIEADGTIARFNGGYSHSPRQFKAGMWPTAPQPKGWWQCMEEHNKTSGLLCGPEVFTALTRLKQSPKGNCFISPAIAEAYSRHPQKGYPRLSFGVSAGRHRDGTELPIWRPGSESGPLMQRFEDIALLRQHSVEVPENAWWMPIAIGTTQAGKPRIDLARNHPQQATLVWFCEGAMSQGKWGWSRSITSPIKGSEKGGSQLLWQTSVSSGGGGIRRTAALLWVTQGGSIGLESGQAIGFDGEQVTRIAGGNVEPGQDPSRD